MRPPNQTSSEAVVSAWYTCLALFAIEKCMSSGLASALYNLSFDCVLCYHCITACNVAIGHMLLHDNLRQVRIQ